MLNKNFKHLKLKIDFRRKDDSDYKPEENKAILRDSIGKQIIKEDSPKIEDLFKEFDKTKQDNQKQKDPIIQKPSNNISLNQLSKIGEQFLHGIVDKKLFDQIFIENMHITGNEDEDEYESDFNDIEDESEHESDIEDIFSDVESVEEEDILNIAENN